ncbi:hypothetical protein ACMGDM_01540 [Sphingomonas sp. DT-51]|uniref:hypothetical protein n=1 Tax=Sphingomonas sp. DT-51 TaxID=3396165 RepID=UPI003F193B2B
MLRRFPLAAIARAAALLCVVGTTAPARAERPISARLVHCGTETCLRLSGHRSGPAVAIRVDGRDLDVAGDRAWQATVTLAEARRWRIVRGYALSVTLADAAAGTERVEHVAVPPGALGTRMELASLIVRAR